MFSIFCKSNVTNTTLVINLSLKDLKLIDKHQKDLSKDEYHSYPSYVPCTLQGYEVEIRRSHFEVMFNDDVYISRTN